VNFKCRSFIVFLAYWRGKITVVANDGNDVEPVEVDRLIIGVLKPTMWWKKRRTKNARKTPDNFVTQ
jgi:hypothetical protein